MGGGSLVQHRVEAAAHEAPLWLDERLSIADDGGRGWVGDVPAGLRLVTPFGLAAPVVVRAARSD